MLKGKSKTPLRTSNPYEKPVANTIKENPVAIVQPQATSKPATTEQAKVQTVAKSSPATVSKTASATPVVEKAQINPSTIASSTDSSSHTKPPHVVSKGDTLYNIATRYGLSVEELKKRNNLSADTISIGQKLLITQ
jgi:LysM repeat protein